MSHVSYSELRANLAGYMDEVCDSRTPLHVTQAAMAGADVATIPPAVLHNLAKHPLTDKGLENFLADWKKTGQTIS